MNYENPANGNKIPPLDLKKTIVVPDAQESEDHPPTMMEKIFITMGMTVAIHPWKFIIASVLISLGFASGFFTVLVTENRPEKQWVPDGAPALEQKDYVDKTWPSEQRFNFWIAQCKKDKNAVPGTGCSLLEPKYIQRMQELNQKLMDIVIDGAEVKESDKKYVAIDQATWTEWGWDGKFSFFENRTVGSETQAKCFKFGPFCGKRTILDIFRDDEAVVNALTTPEIMQAVNFWEGQDNFCPVSIAKLDSPCVNTKPTTDTPNANKLDCQKYTSKEERTNCRAAATQYCNNICPIKCLPAGSPFCRPVIQGTCGDSGCLTLVAFNRLENEAAASADNTTGSAPESAFAFEPFKLKSVLSSGQGPVLAADGSVESARAMFGFYALDDNKHIINGGEEDPIATAWEKEALCILGVDYSAGRDEIYKEKCKKDDLLEFRPNFQRSFGDEFGNAVRADVAKLGSSYIAILVYMFIMLSRRDSVHSQIFIGTMTVVIVGLSYMGCMGLGGYIGLPNNQLNNNIPFLLLGLGVDDAFVLSSEFMRSSLAKPHESTVYHVTQTARHGGISILITSATDALAFLVGSATVLPALSWFCQFAGMGVILCFILQITLFLPALALNSQRAKSNRYDCCCCCGPHGCGSLEESLRNEENDKFHPIAEEKGCCCCIKSKSGSLPMAMRKTGELITTKIGRIVVLAIFVGLFACGVIGSLNIYKDFKLEWFFPDSSYVNEFFDWNNKYFTTGKPVTVYLRDIDYHGAQLDLDKLHSYMNDTKYVDTDEAIEDWHWEFMDSVRQDTSEWRPMLDATSHFPQTEVGKSNYYKALHQWYTDGGGVRYRTRVKWLDTRCENDTIVSINRQTMESVRDWSVNCDVQKGLEASRVSATLRLEFTNVGQDRYDTMTAMRTDLTKVMKNFGGAKTFPYSFEFLYWEEVGIIDQELIRNLAICSACIIVMIGLLIPHPKIAIFVILAILLSVIDLIGFLYFWDVTVSGISTIYILISVGLAVDYSAHIAHMFVESTGTSSQRAISALERIGPSVFNAVFSTLLAVVIIGFSESYVFRVFFKALFLTVLLGGAHGLIFLPTMLSIFGGDKPMSTTSPRPVKNSAVAADDVKEIEMSNVEVEADKTETTI